MAKRMERRCGNPTCQVANYMYGSGWDVLFRHVDDDGAPWVSDVVHEWSGRDVAGRRVLAGLFILFPLVLLASGGERSIQLIFEVACGSGFGLRRSAAENAV